MRPFADCSAVGAVFSALRVHALSQRNWYLSSFTFFWAVLAVPIDYYVGRVFSLMLNSGRPNVTLGGVPSSVLHSRPVSRMRIGGGDVYFH